MLLSSAWLGQVVYRRRRCLSPRAGTAAIFTENRKTSNPTKSATSFPWKIPRVSLENDTNTACRVRITATCGGLNWRILQRARAEKCGTHVQRSVGSESSCRASDNDNLSLCLWDWITRRVLSGITSPSDLSQTQLTWSWVGYHQLGGHRLYRLLRFHPPSWAGYKGTKAFQEPWPVWLLYYYGLGRHNVTLDLSIIFLILQETVTQALLQSWTTSCTGGHLYLLLTGQWRGLSNIPGFVLLPDGGSVLNTAYRSRIIYVILVYNELESPGFQDHQQHLSVPDQSNG